MTKKLSHSVSQELFLIWLKFLVHMCKMSNCFSFFFNFSSNFFSFFQNSDFSGFSEFINKCQKEILRCAPPSHVCGFSSISHFLFNSVSSNIDEILSINPSDVFFFEDLNGHHKDWLTYSGGTDRPGELCYNFSVLSYLKWSYSDH